jgi:hypothetical protein
MVRAQIFLRCLAVIVLCSHMQGLLIPETVAQTARRADVLFVVDNSGGMRSVVVDLQAELNRFAYQISGRGIDLHIVMISASQNQSSQGVCIPPPLGGPCPNDQNLWLYNMS